MAKQQKTQQLHEVAAGKRIARLEDLLPDRQNANKGTERGRGMLERSLRECGAGRSIVVDQHGAVIAGNKTLEAAAEVGLAIRLVQTDGHELVVVQRNDLDLAAGGRARELAYADNRAGEIGLEWDAEQMQADLDAGLDLQPWFSDDELATLLTTKTEAKEGLTDPDAVPAARVTDIQPGDLFDLGKHRLICGDSTKAEDVMRVLAGAVPFLMVTDPPYGVDYSPGWRNDTFRDGAERRTGMVENDDRADWSEAWALFQGDIAYVWNDPLQSDVVKASLALCRLEPRYLLAWAKDRQVFSRGHYHGQYEVCWYCVRAGATARWTGDRSQSTLWSIPQKDNTGDTNHGTQKPVECMERPIRNHGGKDDAVYEPFSGSGTTIIAADRQQRACYAVELSPQYVQVAIDRWQAFTGQKAVKVGEAVRA